jgi:hypothetical protein
MPRSDDPFERLRAAIDELAADDADELLYEARIEARARVRTTLTDALTRSMLEQLHEQLPAHQSPSERPEPPPAPTQPPAPAPAPAPRQPSGELAWYVYGIVGAGTELSGPLDGVAPGNPVTLVTAGELAAVASQVSLDEFDEERLREHLADMEWVEATARAHESVLERVREQATLVPMRMCTLYRTESSMREMLDRESTSLLGALEHLEGKAEWGVKVFTDVARAGGGIRNVDTGAGDPSGAAYMERKRTERERRQQAIDQAEEAAAEVHERLSALAADDALIPLQRPEASGHAGDMILNGVYLVADEDATAFHEEVQSLQSELATQDVELVPSGPWPAYNFVPGAIGAAW